MPSLRPFLSLVLSTAALCAAVRPLTDFQGTYEFENGQNLEIVAGKQLFAVIDEAKYPLKRTNSDSFVNVVGEPVTFERNTLGQVKGYEYHNRPYRRLSAQVSSASAALAYPHPDETAYHYTVPADLDDGIPAGDIRNTPLGASVADEIANGILTERWPDVHSVLLYQGGRLVLEEYFYGYSRERTHQLRSATKSIVSALAGVAIARRALPSADDPVLPHLAYRSYEHPDPRKSKITLANLLSMSSGLDCNDHSNSSPGRETVIDEQPDWVKATLDLPMMNDPWPRRLLLLGRRRCRWPCC